VIPLYDNVPTRRFPIVSVGLIVANVLVFLVDRATAITIPHVVSTPYGLMQVSQQLGGLSARYSMIPALITHSAAPVGIQPAWLTIFTSMFLHGDWLHIGGNMLYLWIFGNNIEDALGRYLFVLFYLACGVAAAGLQIASDPTSTVPTVGASGAIAGLMGAYIWLYPSARVMCVVPFIFIATLMKVPAIIVIGFWFLLQLANARLLGGGMLQGGGIAYMAHVGGFVAGLLLIVVFGGRKLAAPIPYEPEDTYDE
jgi:membrane associated rhomboid family serine protease